MGTHTLTKRKNDTRTRGADTAHGELRIRVQTRAPGPEGLKLRVGTLHTRRQVVVVGRPARQSAG